MRSKRDLGWAGNKERENSLGVVTDHVLQHERTSKPNTQKSLRTSRECLSRLEQRYETDRSECNERLCLHTVERGS